MHKKIVAILGGPGTGKSTLIDELKKKGYCCYPEISRQVTIDAQKNGIDQLFLSDPFLFSKLLLEGRIKQFEDAQKEPHDIVFLDRGIPDVLAYIDYIGDHYPAEFEQHCMINKYTTAFILPPWQEIYLTDNERYETFEQAIEIQKHLVATYKKYDYELIEVPKDTVENRINFILNHI